MKVIAVKDPILHRVLANIDERMKAFDIKEKPITARQIELAKEKYDQE